jgi:hypothetical protein
MPADLTPAEQATARILGRFFRTAPAEMQARNIIEAVRPHLYREAADYVRDVHADLTTAPMSDVVMGGIRSAAAVLEHRADVLARRDEETR